MVLVMRSIVIASGHVRSSLSGPICYGLLLPTRKRDPSTTALVPNACLPPRHFLFRYVPRRSDALVPPVHDARRLASEQNAVVAIYGTHLGAKEAVKKLRA